MDKEIENVKKKYTHKEYLLINDDGEICRLRCSFDKEVFFIRSTTVMNPEIDLLGKPFIKYNPIKILNSNKDIEIY